MTDTTVADVPAGTGAASGRSLSDRLPRPWLFPLLAIAATWVLIVAAWYLANAVYGHQMYWSLYFWYKDAAFYGYLAQHGYPPASAAVPPNSAPSQAAFFPLYPAVLSLVLHAIGGHHPAVAGVITQILTGAASAVAVWALGDHVFGRRVADRTVLLYCAFPGAMVFGMMYSEPLAIALAASCLLATLKRKWVLAGLLALLAGAEHSTMIMLVPTLGIVAIHAVWTRRDWRSLIAPVLAPLGFLAYMAYGAHRYHDLLFWPHIERAGWKERVDFGVHTFKMLTWQYPDESQYPLFYWLILVLFLVALGGIALLIASRAPWPLTLYSALVLVSIFVTQVSIKPRFILTMVGIFLGYANKLPKWAFWPVLAVSAGVLAFYVGYWPHHVQGRFPNP
jgi:hypothetical protein